MHFRDFNYNFSSLIACVANRDVFSESETRVRFSGDRDLRAFSKNAASWDN